MNNNTFDRIVTIFLVVVCIILAVATYVRNAKSDSIEMKAPIVENSKAVNVTALKVIQTNFIRTSKVTGEIISNNKDTIVYPSIGGVVTNVYVSRGDYIEKGEPLFTIDPSKPGMKYNESVVLSPISGTVYELSAAVGDTVTTGTQLLILRGERELKVRTAVSEKNISSLKLGANAIIKSDSNENKNWSAQISYIASELDSASRSLPIELTFSDGSDGLLAGMYVTAYVEVEVINNCISIPSNAISTFAGDEVVYIANDGYAKRCVVETGKSDGSVTIIKSGISEGDYVITAGNVSDGTPINIVAEEE